MERQGTRRVFIVIDREPIRSGMVAEALIPGGKVFEAQRIPEIEAVKQREGHIDGLFVASEIGNLVTNCQRLHDLYPDTPIYVTGQVPLSMLKELVAAGVQDTLSLPIDVTQLNLMRTPTPAVQQTTVRKESILADATLPVDFGAQPPVTRERIIAVGSVKGGEGKTTVAVQLGMHLAKQGLSVLLIDADFTGNATDFARGETINTIAEFDPEKYKPPLDREILENKLVLHKPTGLKILASPVDTYQTVTTEMLRNAIESYKPYYSILIIDLHQGYTPLFHTAKEFATDMIILSIPDLERLDRVREMAEKMRERGVSHKNVSVIVNRVKGDDDVQKVRVALKEFDFPVFSLPYTAQFEKITDRPPLFQDPKLPYARAFRRFLSEGLGFHKKAERTETKPKQNKKRKKQGLFASLLQLAQKGATR